MKSKIAAPFTKPVTALQNIDWGHLLDVLKQQLWRPSESNFEKSLALAFGVFIAFSPFWGYHTLLAIGLAHFLRLNKALVLLTIHLSMPPLCFAIWYASTQVGFWLIPQKLTIDYSWVHDLQPEWLASFLDWCFALLSGNALQFAVGSLVLATITGALSILLFWALLNYFHPAGKNPVALETEETSEAY